MDPLTVPTITSVGEVVETVNTNISSSLGSQIIPTVVGATVGAATGVVILIVTITAAVVCAVKWHQKRSRTVDSIDSNSARVFSNAVYDGK